MNWRKVAYINFWHGFLRPTNGGTLRAHGIYSALNALVESHIISVDDFFSREVLPPGWILQNCDCEQLGLWRKMYLRIDSYRARKGLWLSSDAVRMARMCYFTNGFKGFSHIILTSSDMVVAALLIKRINPAIIIVYDSHNVDYLWLKSISKSWRRTRAFERILPKLVDEVWCCSEKDRIDFIELNQNFKIITKVVPNGGVPRERLHPLRNTRCAIGIIGAWDYPPNSDGLLWFLTEVIPKIDTSYELLVCGSGTLSSKLHQLLLSVPRASFVGFIPNVSDFYSQISLLAIPLLHGSGTRLKVIEAMSFGMPIVSTSKGVEGIDVEDGNHCLISDDPLHFAQSINLLARNMQLRDSLSIKALSKFNECYTWNKIIQDAIN
jgi:glycosyltransferase involved in cell wall biosynthesis